MSKHRIWEIVCVIVLILFIGYMSSETPYSDKTVGEVAETVTETADIAQLKKIKKNKIREDFGIDFEGIDSFVYYASDAIMDVRELMIIKLKEGVNPDEITEKIEKRVNDKQVLFEGYAPEQGAMLKEHVLTYKSGFIFYAVGEDVGESLASFKSSLR